MEVRQFFAAEEAEVGAYAALSSDVNKIHVDSEYAEESMFGERVVHGTFALGWVSACLADLPTDADVILTGLEDIHFENPIGVGEQVEVCIFPERDVDREATGRVSFYFEIREPGTETQDSVKLSGEGSVYLDGDDDG